LSLIFSGLASLHCHCNHLRIISTFMDSPLGCKPPSHSVLAESYACLKNGIKSIFFRFLAEVILAAIPCRPIQKESSLFYPCFAWFRLSGWALHTLWRRCEHFQGRSNTEQSRLRWCGAIAVLQEVAVQSQSGDKSSIPHATFAALDRGFMWRCEASMALFHGPSRPPSLYICVRLQHQGVLCERACKRVY